MTRAWPERLQHRRGLAQLRVRSALDQGDEARDGPGVRRRARLSASSSTRGDADDQGVALSAAAAQAPPRRGRRPGGAARGRAPARSGRRDAPIGWPSAMPPPLTFTLSRRGPSSFADWSTTCANASLISTRSRSAAPRPCLPSAWAMALAGCDCSELSGPATLPWAPISASQAQAQFLGLGLGHDHHRARAVGDLRGRTGGDGAVLGERGAQSRQLLGGGVGADALVRR